MKKYIDYITIPIGLLLYWLMNIIGNKYDIHMFGIAPLQKIILALTELLIVLGFTMIIIRIKFPSLYKMIDSDFDEKNKWNALDKKTKTLAGLFLFSLVFFCFCMLIANQ